MGRLSDEKRRTLRDIDCIELVRDRCRHRHQVRYDLAFWDITTSLDTRLGFGLIVLQGLVEAEGAVFPPDVPVDVEQMTEILLSSHTTEIRHVFLQTWDVLGQIRRVW